ncbi:MAG: ATP-binding protein [Promethearchaeota archaeon]
MKFIKMLVEPYKKKINDLFTAFSKQMDVIEELFNGMNLPIVILDASRKIVYNNELFSRLFSEKRGDLLHANFFKAIGGHFLISDFERLFKMMEDDSRVFFEDTIYSKKGEANIHQYSIKIYKLLLPLALNNDGLMYLLLFKNLENQSIEYLKFPKDAGWIARALKNINVHVILTDSNMIMRYVSPSVLEFTNRTFKEVAGQNISKLVHFITKDGKKLTLKNMLDDLPKVRSIKFPQESFLTCKNQGRIKIQGIFSWTSISQGEDDNLIFVFWRKYREETKTGMLTSQKISFHDVLDSLAIPLVIFNKTGSVIFSNSAWASFTRYKKAEIQKMKVSNFFGEKFSESIFKNLSGGNAFSSHSLMEYKCLIKDGIPITTKLFINVVVRNDDERYIIIQTIDTRDENLVLLKLKHLASILRAIRNVNQLITHEKDRMHLLKAASTLMTETRGYTTTWIALISDNGEIENVFGSGVHSNALDKFMPVLKKKIPSCYKEVIDNPKTISVHSYSRSCNPCPLENFCKDHSLMLASMEHYGKVFGIISVIVPELMLNEDFELELFKEIANDLGFALYEIELEEEKKQILRELRASEQKSQDAFKRVEFFKDLFVHDIKNILQGILTKIEYCQLLAKKPDMKRKLETNLSSLKFQVLRGGRLVTNINKLSRIDDGILNTISINIIEVLKECINNLKELHSRKSINVDLKVDDEKIFINTNDLIVDVFENILNNAVIHNKNNNIEISITVRKINRGQKSIIRLEFNDNGIGIEGNRKMRIFDRVGKDPRNIHGMGLGLSLVKKIIESINGDIWVEDRIEGDYSKGSKFIIEIPEV